MDKTNHPFQGNALQLDTQLLHATIKVTFFTSLITQKGIKSEVPSSCSPISLGKS